MMDQDNTLPVLKVADLQVSCRGRPIFAQASFAIPAASVTSIVGPSGAGKTTLLKCLNGLLDEDPSYVVKGERWLRGASYHHRGFDLYQLRRQVGIVFQKPTIFPTTIQSNVLFGLRARSKQSKSHRQLIVERSLRDAGLWDEVHDRLKDKGQKLSIGQQQRLAIARTLALQPEVILLDEPTASLDLASAQKIEQLILSLKGSRSLVVVTHDHGFAQRISDQILVFNQVATEGWRIHSH